MEKRMITRRIVLISAMIICLFFCSLAIAEPQNPKKATVMIYACGADLESDNQKVTRNMNLIYRSGFNREEINVVVLEGGSEKWWRRAEFDTTKLHVVEAGNRRQTDADLWEYSSMGDPATLSRFLTYCKENYPADSYYLVMLDHGAGPNDGLCMDNLMPLGPGSLFAYDSLSVNELADALRDSPFRDQKLEIICFDTCLTGTIEYAAAVSPYARYMVAAEEDIQGTGYEWIADLDKDPDPLAIAKKIADQTHERNQSDVSVAVIDLDKTDDISSRMDIFFTKLNSDTIQTGFSELYSIRQNIIHFGRSKADYFDLADLGDLVNQLRGYAPEEADDLLKAINEAVVYKVPEDSPCSGLAVYHPLANLERLNINIETYDTISPSASYTDYIQWFALNLQNMQE